MTTLDKLTPADPRVEHRTFVSPHSSLTYHYLLAEPSGSTPPAATVLLVHGFPDLSLGWRYQVPHLLSLGLRVVAPDLLGFGRSDAPRDLGAYSFKRVTDDLAALVRPHIDSGDGKIVLGGHDWGGAVVWRFVLWHPDLVKGVFSVCTPFPPVKDTFFSKAEIVKRMPWWGYQVQFEGSEVEEAVVGREKIRALLAVMFGAARDDGETVFTVRGGLDAGKLEPGRIGESPLMSREELDYYADEFARNGMRGPLCWYKTGQINFDEEKKLLEEGKTRITAPALFIGASRDAALPPSLWQSMDSFFDRLVKREVDATHWALWEQPAKTNEYIGEFISGILKGRSMRASI